MTRRTTTGLRTLVLLIVLMALPAGAEAACQKIPLGAEGAYRCKKPDDTRRFLSRGPLMWRYYGQAIFGDETGEYAGPAYDALAAVLDRRAGHPDVVRPGVADYHRTLRVDKEGRQWLVQRVHWDSLGAVVAEYDAVAGEPAEADDASDIGVEDDGGFDVPLSWSDGTCLAGTVDWALWDVDDRVVLSGSSLTDRQQTEVLTISGTGNIGCSATIVSDTHVLTAAHCVTGPSGGAHNPANTSVFAGGNALYDNFEVVGANAIVLDGPPWNGNVNTDYALIETDDDLEDTNGRMLLSQASNSTINGNRIRNLGFPAVGPTASSCGVTSLMIRQTGWSDNVTTKQVRTELDAASGQSGGAVYYCPSNDPNQCLAGEDGFIISVLTAMHFNVFGSVTDVRGPRVKHFRTWALGIL